MLFHKLESLALGFVDLTLLPYLQRSSRVLNAIGIGV